MNIRINHTSPQYTIFSKAGWTLYKTIRGYSRLSLGFYKQTTSDQASDYSWYQNAPGEFYNYAVDVSSQGLRPYIPMAQA